MPRHTALTAILAVLAALAAAGPVRGDEILGSRPRPMSIRPPLAERGPVPMPPHAQRQRLAPAAAMPPEERYRDPRYVAQRPIARPFGPPRRAPRFAGPSDLIEAYLPRYTEQPMFNEPPTRFPARW